MIGNRRLAYHRHPPALRRRVAGEAGRQPGLHRSAVAGAQWGEGNHADRSGWGRAVLVE